MTMFAYAESALEVDSKLTARSQTTIPVSVREPSNSRP